MAGRKEDCCATYVCKGSPHDGAPLSSMKTVFALREMVQKLLLDLLRGRKTGCLEEDLVLALQN